jgi:eukaryotic-like serine/threonine-protein kinase
VTVSPGTRLGAYEILGKLGEGGMGEVYRARDTKLHRDVAIKVLPALFASDVDRLARFEREARIVASFNHPNIATVYGLEEQGTLKAIVMELVDGETLDTRIRAKGRLSAAETIAIARQLVDALDAAHERGVIHRDLKPANITISADGLVKVLDFGIAIDPAPVGGDAATFMTPVTQPGFIMGTAAYMSPEQARGQAVDKRADIWAFGCVLYELLTGTSPFAGASISDVIAHVLEREPDWNALPASTPQSLVRLIRRCVQKDLKKRLRDIADARPDLEDALAPVAVAPRAASSGSWLPWTVAAATLATVAAAWWLFAPGRDSGPRLSRAVRLTNSAAREFSPAISPDNKWVAYYSELNGRTDLWVKFLDSGASINLTGSLNLDLPMRAVIGGLAISPDNSTIAVASRAHPELPGYDTWLIPAPVGGVPRKLLSLLQGMQWSPDGKQIVCVRPGSQRGDALVLADADGNNQRDLLAAQGGRHVHWPMWSRDQRWIYFISSYDTANSGQSEIYRISVEGGAAEPVIATSRRAIFPCPAPDGGLLYAANPDGVDLTLWWSNIRGGAPRQLTMGVGEYSDARLSSDGSKLVATISDTLQSAIYRASVSDEAGQLIRVTDGFSGDMDPAIDLTHDRLVFSSARSGHRNLWISKLDGGDAHPLTTENSTDVRPAVSPDGREVAFVSDRGGKQGIWVVSTDGGVAKLLTTARVVDTLTWSRDGARVIYAVPGGETPKLESVSLSNGRVEAVALPTASGVAPAASPTADVIAYLDPGDTSQTGGPYVSRMSLTFTDGRGARAYQNIPAEAFTNGTLAWSPDGRRLAALRFPMNAAGSVWVLDTNGAPAPRKVIDLPVSMFPRGLAWTPDSTSLLISGVEASSDIVLFDVTR